MGGAFLVPAIVLTSCGDSETNTFKDMAKAQIELGSICKDTIDGKLDPDAAADKINALAADSKPVFEKMKAYMEDEKKAEAMKKKIEEFEKTDEGKTLKAEHSTAMDHIISATVRVKNKKFSDALSSFGK